MKLPLFVIFLLSWSLNMLLSLPRYGNILLYFFLIIVEISSCAGRSCSAVQIPLRAEFFSKISTYLRPPRKSWNWWKTCTIHETRTSNHQIISHWDRPLNQLLTAIANGVWIILNALLLTQKKTVTTTKVRNFDKFTEVKGIILSETTLPTSIGWDYNMYQTPSFYHI